MPFNATGGWVDWTCNLTQNNTVDPISGSVACATNASLGLGVVMVIFLGALYVFLWVRFSSSPSRFKLVGMTALVLAISVVAVLGGFLPNAILNIVLFILAYFVSLLFKY